VGRLHRDKGFDLLIQAYARIAGRHPDWDLVILGEGGERQSLQAMVDAAGLQARVSMPGRVGNVGDWYASADIYVLSSRFEGLSNTLLESLASGLTAVCFDCDTGPREVVREGVDGVLVRPNGDVAAMAAALSALMSDDETRRALASRAVEARERFSAQRVLGLWQQLFDDVRGQGSSRRPPLAWTSTEETIMCGIVGIWGTLQDKAQVLAESCRRIRHRGPDSEGFWEDPAADIALAHVRLAILDLTEAGHQPMV